MTDPSDNTQRASEVVVERSNRRDVRNPVLALPGVAELQALLDVALARLRHGAWISAAQVVVN